MDSELFLIFVRLIGENTDKSYRYEFLFSNNPDETYGDNWEYKPCCLVNDLKPSDEYITKIKILNTKIKFDLIQDSCCMSLGDCMDGIIAVAYENIDTYEIYPEEGRLYFMFGDSLEEVEERLAKKNLLFVNTLNIEL